MESAIPAILEERVAALEESIVRLNRLVMIGLLSGLALLSVNWLASRPSKNLVVNSVELRDNTGVVRSRLAMNHDETASLTMFDHKGSKLLTLGQTYKGSSALTLYDGSEPRVQLTSIANGASSLRFLDGANESMSSVFMRPKKGMGISFATSEEGMFFGLNPSGEPGVRSVNIAQVKKGRKKLILENLERFSEPNYGAESLEHIASEKEKDRVPSSLPTTDSERSDLSARSHPAFVARQARLGP